jgi:hypothetical protein
MRRVKLYQGSDVWYVRMLDESDIEELSGLGMPDVLPTPWFSHAPRERVVAKLQKINPDWSIE